MERIDKTSIENDLLALFSEVFKTRLAKDDIEKLQFKQYPQWDSLTQMILVQEIESRFGVMLDFSELMSFTSFKSGLELVSKKLGL